MPTKPRFDGAAGSLLKMKLSIRTKTPKTMNPQAAWLRIPTPIEIDMKATILQIRFPFMRTP